MDELEKVERLRERANVTYEEAKKALEECNWDLLDAMVYLEKQGKVKKPGTGNYSTQYEEPEEIKEAADRKKSSGGITDMLNRFFRWCAKMVQKGNETYFKVEKDGKTRISIPVTVFVILVLLFFWAIFLLMVIGLFVGCRYSFEGVDEVKVNINRAMDKAADVADSIKEELNGKDGE